MKKLFKKLFKLPIRALAAGAVLAIGIGMAPKAQAQANAYNTTALTNVPAIVAAGVGVFLTNSAQQVQVIPLRKNCCMSLIGRANASAAGAEVLAGSFTIDGTNFGVSPFVLSNTLAVKFPTNEVGMPVVTSGTNFTQAQLSGFVGVAFTSVTNTSTGTASNWVWSVNVATLNTQTF